MKQEPSLGRRRHRPGDFVDAHRFEHGGGDVRADSFGGAVVPDDFIKEIARNKKANAFFETLNKTNLYSIAYRLQTAKTPETRQKRTQAIIEKLARGEKFH